MKTIKYLAMAALTLIMTTSCSNDDNEITQQPSMANGIPFSATISMGESASTRALAEDGVNNKIIATWGAGDKVALIHNGVSDEMTVSSVSGGVATITGTITGSPTTGDEVTVIYPSTAADGATGNVKADLLKFQDGTLNTIAQKFDVRKGTGTLKVSGSASLNGTISLTNQYAIMKFTLSGVSAKVLTLKDYSTNALVTHAATSSETSTFYMAIPAAVNNTHYWIRASDGTTIYEKDLLVIMTEGIESGKFYQTTISTWDDTHSAIVNLGSLTGNYPATDLQVLTGTLCGDYKITIVDGATVTLKDVDITNITNDISHNWAGITCLGDAAVILEGTNIVYSGFEDCSGFIGASGKTLTIRGSGSLETRPTGSNRCGSGILIGENGHIVIQDGTIVANGYDACAGIGISGTGTVTITGGHITAQGGTYAAGIGSGNASTCGAINISGGTIIAKGGGYAAAIGGGNWSVHGDITITSGVTSVTATKGSGSVHSIGNGYNPKTGCGTVSIGGTIYWDGAYQNGGETILPNSPLVYPFP